jgi:chromosome segregation ATPase
MKANIDNFLALQNNGNHYISNNSVFNIHIDEKAKKYSIAIQDYHTDLLDLTKKHKNLCQQLRHYADAGANMNEDIKDIYIKMKPLANAIKEKYKEATKLQNKLKNIVESRINEELDNITQLKNIDTEIKQVEEKYQQETDPEEKMYAAAYIDVLKHRQDPNSLNYQEYMETSKYIISEYQKYNPFIELDLTQFNYICDADKTGYVEPY